MNYRRGAAITELALAAPLFGMALAACVTFVRTSAMRQRALAVARFGAELKSSGLVSDQDADREVVMAASALHLPAATPFELGRFLETPASHFYRLDYARVNGEIVVLQETNVE
jgi:hypothetical protein